MTDRIGRVPQVLGYTPTGAEVVGNRVRLKLATDGGRYSHTIEADHVIAATGYRPKLDRLTFIPTTPARLHKHGGEHPDPVIPFSVQRGWPLFHRSHRSEQLRPADALCLRRQIHGAPAFATSRCDH